MLYTQEQVAELATEYETVREKYEDLALLYLKRNYTNASSREHATQGLLRRLSTLVRCIENVFSTLPPERDELPDREELTDAAINLQAFVVNVFGALDNLAWIWVHEKSLTKPDGSPLPASWVGLAKGNELVRASFSPAFGDYLKTLDPWFAFMVDFRHAVAHRIPLYIPPYAVTPANAAAYEALAARMSDAVRRSAYDEYERLEKDQLKLASFRPLMKHSFEERSTTVIFHTQMLADFNTVEEVGRKMFNELP